MDISEMDDAVKELSNKERELTSLDERITKLHGDFEAESEKLKLLSELSDVTGESYERMTPQANELQGLEEQRRNLEKGTELLKTKIFDGIASLKIPIKVENIKPSNGQIEIEYKSPGHSSAVNYLMKILNFKDQLNIDGVIFESDRIKVQGTNDPIEALRRFKDAVKTIWLLGSQLQGKSPPEIDEICEKFRSSKHPQIWEKLGEMGAGNPASIAKELELDEKLVNDTLYNWTRKEKWKSPPISRRGRGNYVLTTLGRFAWLRYKQRFMKKEISEEEQKSEDIKVEEPQQQISKEATLNKFFETVFLERR